MNPAPLRKHVASGLRVIALMVFAIVVAGTPTLTHAAETLKIGIIGAGKMGGALAELWAKAGHEVMISSRHPDELKDQAKAIGPKAYVGTTQDAAKFGSVVVVAMVLPTRAGRPTSSLFASSSS